MKVENLKDTSEMMCSSDYKERFKAEYYQLKMRFSALDKMLINYMSGRLSFTPSCPYNMLHEQLVFMERYLVCLEQRAKIEGIEL